MEGVGDPHQLSLLSLLDTDRGLPLSAYLFIVANGASYSLEVYLCGVINIVKYGIRSRKGIFLDSTSLHDDDTTLEYVQQSIKRVPDIPFNVSLAKPYRVLGDRVVLALCALDTIYFCEVDLSAGTCVSLAELKSNSSDINSFDLINNSHRKHSGSSSNERCNYIIYSDTLGMLYSYLIVESAPTNPAASGSTNFNFVSTCDSMILSSNQSPSIVKFLSTAEASVSLSSSNTPYDAVCLIVSSEGNHRAIFFRLFEDLQLN